MYGRRQPSGPNNYEGEVLCIAMVEIANESALSEAEQTIVEDVALDVPWSLLETFSELVRVSGTEDEARAAAYIYEQLDSFGVDVRRYDPELYISRPQRGTLRTLNHEFEPGQTKTVAFSASTTVSGPVTYVGSGDVQGLLEERDSPQEPYAGIGDLSDTIALTEAGSLSIRETQRLAEKGALGVIAIHQHEREPHDGIATPVWGGAPPLREKDRIPDIPIVNVTKPDGERLRELAADDDGLEVELETELDTGWFECPIIETRIEGDADTDEFLLLHGHYDSWDVGITDNATGDGGLLELARVFDRHSDLLDRNLRIAWWPAHSTGRYAGSTWYADEFALELVNNCVAQVNMDSPGAKDTTEYTSMACWTPETHDVVGSAIEDVADVPYDSRHPPRAGDYSFDNFGITGFFMLSSNIPAEIQEERGYHPVGGCGGNSDAWHLSTDTMDKAGREELLRDIRVYAVAILRVLNADILPFDYRRTTNALRTSAAEYNDAAGDGIDLTPTLELLAALEDDLDTFYTDVEVGSLDPATANEAILDVSRRLTRLNLVERGQFEQDPATTRKPLPKLAPAAKLPYLDETDARFLQVQLRRAQNEIRYQLQQARAALPAADR